MNIDKQPSPFTSNVNVAVLNQLVPEEFDYIELTYTGDNPTTIVYKIGGSSGTIVATLTLTYEGCNLLTVTKT